MVHLKSPSAHISKDRAHIIMPSKMIAILGTSHYKEEEKYLIFVLREGRDPYLYMISEGEYKMHQEEVDLLVSKQAVRGYECLEAVISYNHRSLPIPREIKNLADINEERIFLKSLFHYEIWNPKTLEKYNFPLNTEEHGLQRLLEKTFNTSP